MVKVRSANKKAVVTNDAVAEGTSGHSKNVVAKKNSVTNKRRATNNKAIAKLSTATKSPRRAQSAMRAGIYARVSTHNQQTRRLQTKQMRDYLNRRGWTLGLDGKPHSRPQTAALKMKEIKRGARVVKH